MLVAFPDIKRNYYKLLSTTVMRRTFLTPIRKWKQTPMRVTNLTKRGGEQYYFGGAGKGSFHWNVYFLRETWSSEESFGLSGRAGPSQTGPSRAIFPFRLVWFWMGCSSCPQTHPVETCAGIVRSELEGDRPLWNTQERKAGLNNQTDRDRQTSRWETWERFSINGRIAHHITETSSKEIEIELHFHAIY